MAAISRFIQLLVLLSSATIEAADAPAQNSYPISLTRGSRLMISARIDGRPVEALLDSAAEATLLNRQLATSLQLLEGTAATGHGSGESAFEATRLLIDIGGGLGGAQQRQMITLRTLDVAGQRFTDVPAAIDPQSTASDVNIGVSILRQFIITTDFSKRAVWLERRTTK